MMDDEFWRKQVDDFGPRLYRYFCSRWPNDVASDLVQETLIRLVKKCRDGDYRSERGTLTMYAFGLAHFVNLEHSRSRRRMDSSDVDNLVELSTPGPESEVLVAQSILHLRQAIGSLPRVQQDILTLVLDEELSLAQIGAIMGMPEGTVKSHLHRAKRMLAQKLSHLKEVL